ncbi:hypothetical protein BCR32DRAFT_158165 [Anaeromyces robustus]|uniref:Uncharacterized protein n=1 Tax=Anaeromyces robustus TaxID=1754192 RepID=A0A1Y1UUN4_9FUNG|nr:hypothetical protein BCR32DRAFT_158165 [Anaeromyces robustus]|eukprot:ORX41729.1 hypothetical protein BCR32DRAFT_158165 [Anaeromyces robustus]
MMKLSKIEKIGQPPIFPDNNVETYFIPSSHSKKNTVKNQNNIESINNNISIIPIDNDKLDKFSSISNKLELDENLSFMCGPIYKPSFFFTKKTELKDDHVKEDNNENKDNNCQSTEELEEKQEIIEQKKSLIKSKSTDSIAIRKRELNEKRKKKENILKNSIKDLRNCYDTSLSKSRVKKKSEKAMNKSNSTILNSSMLNSSSTTLARTSSSEYEKEELKNVEKLNKSSSRGSSDKKKPTMKKPINYLRSNNKSIINTKSRYLLSSNSSSSIKSKKDKTFNDDIKSSNKRKGNMNVSLPLSISIPYSSIKKGSKSSSKGQKVRSSSSFVERKNITSKGKLDNKRIKSIPLNISLSVSAPNINDEDNENLSSNGTGEDEEEGEEEEEGFDSSYCNNSFNKYDNNISNHSQCYTPDVENNEYKKNYIIENIIVTNENENTLIPPIIKNNYSKINQNEIKYEQYQENENEILKSNFFSNMANNRINYSSSETDKMYYYNIDENDIENLNQSYYKQNNNDEEDKENKDFNRQIINKNINNVIQKAKKELLKKNGKNEDIWSIKSEPIDYSEKENKKTIFHQKSILKKTENINSVTNNDIFYSNDEYNITYNMPPDYSMIPSSPPHSENLIPSAPPSMYEEKSMENKDFCYRWNYQKDQKYYSKYC